jgi:hypothetical protein
VPPAPSIPAGGQNPRELLDQIAAAVKKESLAPTLHSLAGARLVGEAVVLDFGPAPNEFFLGQLRDNIAVIAEAASSVLGRKVQVRLDEGAAAPETLPRAPAAAPGSEEDILNQARKEPVVQSFLDAFPGPVKAEKLKP